VLLVLKDDKVLRDGKVFKVDKVSKVHRGLKDLKALALKAPKE
jgi:hypothetical protein